VGHCAQIVPVRIGIGGELYRLNRVELLRGFDEIAFADDVVALDTERVLCPVICIATRSGIPARTRFRPAVRRRSCGIRPGQPACAHAFLHAFPGNWTRHTRTHCVSGELGVRTASTLHAALVEGQLS
jgi:hypothetical protein